MEAGVIAIWLHRHQEVACKSKDNLLGYLARPLWPLNEANAAKHTLFGDLFLFTHNSNWVHHWTPDSQENVTWQQCRMHWMPYACHLCSGSHPCRISKPRCNDRRSFFLDSCTAEAPNQALSEFQQDIGQFNQLKCEYWKKRSVPLLLINWADKSCVYDRVFVHSTSSIVLRCWLLKSTSGWSQDLFMGSFKNRIESGAHSQWNIYFPCISFLCSLYYILLLFGLIIRSLKVWTRRSEVSGKLFSLLGRLLTALKAVAIPKKDLNRVQVSDADDEVRSGT